MLNQAISEMLLDKREEWQNATIREMQEKLNSRPTGRYLVADYKKSLVVVYGNPQIGKTSLILNIMGVLPEYQHEVYSVLRANSEYGDSSTVTAIIYLISPSDQFGISSSDENDKEIEFYSNEAMCQTLSNIRKRIESGDRECGGVLYIFIPRMYFCKDVLENESFSIMDLPGINSRNILERTHVDNVVSRYMSMATVKMIVTKGDSIQDLSDLGVPEGLDWRMFPNKYFVVVTMAFSQGSVSSYFKKKKEERGKSFSEFLREAYEEIPQIIQSAKMEWYPIDVGDSFQNLLNSYHDDHDEIVETQHFFLQKIREAVVKRKGNGLNNIINDLKSYSKEYYRIKMWRLSNDIEKMKKDLKSKQKLLKKTVIDKDKCENVFNRYTYEDVEVFRIIGDLNLKPFWDDLYKKIVDFTSNFENDYPERFKDRDFKLVEKYCEFAKGLLESCNSLRDYLGESIFNKIYSKEISLDEWDNLKDLLTEQKIRLKEILKPKGIRSYFGIKREVIREVIMEMSKQWAEMLKKNIISDIEKKISEISLEKEKYFEINQLLRYKYDEEEKLTRDIKLLSKKLKTKEEEELIWKNKEKIDNELLVMYLKVAKQEYEKSKCKIKNEMRDSSIERQLQYLILLGLMEQDYNTIVEGK